MGMLGYSLHTIHAIIITPWEIQHWRYMYFSYFFQKIGFDISYKLSPSGTYILGKVGKIIQILVCFTQHAQYVHVSGLRSEVQFTRECFFFPGPLLLLALFIRYQFALLNAAQVFPKPIPTFPSQKSLGFSSFEVKCITDSTFLTSLEA